MNKDDDIPMASRAGSSNPFGKCTEEIKTLVPYEVKEGFARLANDNGMTPSEFMRELVMVRVLGVDGVRKIYDQRLNRVAGIRQE